MASRRKYRSEAEPAPAPEIDGADVPPLAPEPEPVGLAADHLGAGPVWRAITSIPVGPIANETSIEDDEPSRLGAVVGALNSMELATANPLDVIGDLLAKAPEPAPRKTTMQGVAAPVSREPSGYSGRRAEDNRRVTLSPEQRAIARNSFGPVKGRNGQWVDLTDAQKERLYANNLLRLRAMRESGAYE